MQTDLERNSCMLCGEIWNSTNLIKAEIKGHQLRMCPECASDFDSYVKDKIIAELEDLFEKMRRRNRQEGHDDYWYFSSGINLTILDKRICELKGVEWKPYIDRKIEAELKGE